MPRGDEVSVCQEADVCIALDSASCLIHQKFVSGCTAIGVVDARDDAVDASVLMETLPYHGKPAIGGHVDRRGLLAETRLLVDAKLSANLVSGFVKRLAVDTPSGTVLSKAFPYGHKATTREPCNGLVRSKIRNLGQSSRGIQKNFGGDRCSAEQ